MTSNLPQSLILFLYSFSNGFWLIGSFSGLIKEFNALHLLQKDLYIFYAQTAVSEQTGVSTTAFAE